MTQDTNTEPKNKVMYSPEGLTQLILKCNLYGYVIGNYNYYSLMLYRKKSNIQITHNVSQGIATEMFASEF